MPKQFLNAIVHTMSITIFCIRIVITEAITLMKMIKFVFEQKKILPKLITLFVV